MNSWVNLSALWRIVVIGLLAGAGLPALFAVGLKALSLPSSGTPSRSADSSQVVGGSTGGIAVAGVCFAVVVAAIAYGIYLVVNGS